ncbi:hypothetical protein D3C72_1676170 [compost metagenome]
MGIELPPGGKAPGFVDGRLPVGQVAAAGQQAQVMLPMAQGGRIVVVDLDQIEQRRCALRVQPVVEQMAEATEPGIFAVAQRQHRVMRARQRRRCAGALHPARKGRRRVGRVAFSIGAHHEQHAAIGGQARHVQLVQRGHAHVQAAGAQGFRGLRGQGLGIAGLAGVGDQQGVFRRGGVQGMPRQRLPCVAPPGAAPRPKA